MFMFRHRVMVVFSDKNLIMINKYNLRDRSDKELAAFNKRKRMEKSVEKVLDTAGELPPEEYSNIYRSLLTKKNRFIDGTKEDRAMIKREANQMKEAIVAYRSFRQDLAAAYKTGSLMSTWADGEQGEAVMGLLDDAPRLVQKKCPEGLNCADKDQIGVIMPDFGTVNDARQRMFELHSKRKEIITDENTADEYNDAMTGLKEIVENQGAKWTDIANLKKMIRLKDNQSQDVLSKMGNNYLRTSSNALERENPQFNELAARRQVRATLVDKASNIQSLAYDEMIPGRVFFNDIKEKTKLDFMRARGGNANPQEAEEFADRTVKFMINDPRYQKQFKEELTNYFTGFLRKQYNMGTLNRRRVEEPNVNQKTIQDPKQPVQYKPGIIAASVKK